MVIVCPLSSIDKSRYFGFNRMMQPVPQFPSFKPIELADRQCITEILREHWPGTSELTFTNLFIWRNHYDFQWSVYKDWLCLIGREGQGTYFAMGLVGPEGRADIVMPLLEWLKVNKEVSEPLIERVDEGLALEVSNLPGLVVEERREHFDYVYLTRDLIELAGSRYRTKRNHINQFYRTHESYTYETLDQRHLDACLRLQEQWCLQRRCDEDLNLLGEWDVTKEILNNYGALGVAGAVILVDGQVKAFTLGERLAEDMAVIHIEKADPGVPGLYQLINQQFCARQWHNLKFINREQDLGIPGLRGAKLSYNPDHFIKKYRVTLKR